MHEKESQTRMKGSLTRMEGSLTGMEEMLAVPKNKKSQNKENVRK